MGLRKHALLYLMILPGTIGFIVFHYLSIYGILIGFQKYDLVLGMSASKWVGLEHFKTFFADPFATRIIKNTLLLGFYSLLWGFWPPIVLALLFNEMTSRRWKKIFQSVSYLPHFIAMVVIVGMMVQLLSPTGPINELLNSLGLPTLNFFTDPGFFRSLYVGSGIWQEIGWGAILYLAALTGIDPALYEAAYMDGANRLRRMWHISLPGMMPTISILLILSTSQIVNVGFEKVFLMYNPANYSVSDVVQTYVYRMGIENRNFSYATAVGLLNSVTAFIILWVANRASRALRQEALW